MPKAFKLHADVLMCCHFCQLLLEKVAKITLGESGSLLQLLLAIAKAFCLDAFVSHHGSHSSS